MQEHVKTGFGPSVPDPVFFMSGWSEKKSYALAARIMTSNIQAEWIDETVIS